jgi:hypothetical protein
MVQRDWLSYPLSENKIYCLHCMLFGKHPQKVWCLGRNDGRRTSLIPSLVEEKKK